MILLADGWGVLLDSDIEATIARNLGFDAVRGKWLAFPSREDAAAFQDLCRDAMREVIEARLAQQKETKDGMA